MPKHSQIIVREIPRGALAEGHFELQQGEVPTPSAGELLVRTLLISLDAANRAWMQGPTYRRAVKAGDVMHGYVIGQVVQSRAEAFAAGDVVAGEGGWAEFVTMAAAEASPVPPERPLSHHISVFGIAGKTAYHGLMQIGAPQPGETVAVSAAAGSVGSLVGQIARLKGARAVGIAGGSEKCRWLVDELGFDEAVDYKERGFAKRLAAACPDGIDVYFDNTAGAISDAVYRQLAVGARCAVCGTASLSSWEPWPEGPRLERHILVKRARIQGFLLFDYTDRFAEARGQLAAWLAEGKLVYREDVLDGLEAAPGAIERLYRGENQGKLLIRVGDEPGS